MNSCDNTGFGGLALGVGYGNIGGVLNSVEFNTHFEAPSEATQQALAAAVQMGSIVGTITVAAPSLYRHYTHDA